MAGSDRRSDRDLGTLFPGDSELSRRMRALDWSTTGLGTPDRWPEHWCTAARLCLTSRIPIVMYWGPEFTVLYNDPYISFLGGSKHPRYLGQPGRECWSEIWDTIGPMLDSVYATGKATWSEDLLMFFARKLPREEVYVRFTFGPIISADGRTVDGIFCPCTETTEQVVSARRLQTLRRLGVQRASGRTVEATCREAADVLASNHDDIPFAAIYLTDESGTRAELSSVIGLSETAHPLPHFAAIGDADGSRWPLASVLRNQRAADTTELLTQHHRIQAGPWSDLVTKAVVLPIPSSVQRKLAGLLVMGVSPRRVLDPAYRTFLDLVAGHLGSAIGVARAYDIERTRAESLAELDRAKTAFFSNVSHEFRSPLTLMLGPIEDGLADTFDPLPPGQRVRQEIAHRSAIRLLRLVNTLLDFSSIEAGRIEAVYEPVDLAAATTDLASQFRSAVERAGLRIVVQCPPLAATVHVDRDMWDKIVMNLLSNAFKFTLEGTIEVTLREAGAAVELVVRDTGIGIAAGELPHVFERFHRVRGARGRTHEGSGIGLALVQELVKLHRGSIRVESELRHGTTFTVTIPFGTAHLPPDRIGAVRTLPSTSIPRGATPYVEEALRWLPDGAAPAGASETVARAVIPRRAMLPTAVPERTRGALVLLADDNADMRHYLRHLLGEHFTVEAVADGQAALDAARDRPPDLVLADVMMPHLDGFGLLRALRADPATRSIPVILVSARAGESSRVQGIDAGADDYLVKPFSARELIARVGTHLDLARTRHEMMEREQAARLQAEQANRAKDEFLAVLSHELRTPLNAILGWAVMLRAGPADPASLSRALEVIEQSARAQSQLIEDLLDVSRIITGKLRLDVRPVDPVAVINAAIEAVRPTLAAKDIRLQSTLDARAGPIAGDPDRLQQVMWNLLANAVKFTPRGGRLQVRLARVSAQVEIAVSDTGCGIDAEVLPYVFDRFWQADSSSIRRHGGLGLGLALVKHLIELHGGTIEVESPGAGRGTRFVIQLPLMTQAAQVTARRQPTAARLDSLVESFTLAGLRLLIVDDEQETLELFTSMFTRLGAEVTTVRSAAEALGQIEATHADVLICDIEMPDEDGYALIRRVRAFAADRGGTIPAVAVTAYGSVDDRIRALASGFQMHVPKPVEPAELLTVVASLAGRTGR